MVKIFLSFLLLFSFMVNVAFAIEPYDTVYRADDRGPDVVFQTGFLPHGTNINVESHLTGWSSGAYVLSSNRNSNFISTTIDYDTAVSFAGEHVRSGEYYYVYDIRPTENFYSAEETMNSIANYQQVSLSNELRYLLIGEGEYFSYGEIPNTLIRSVDVYYRNPITHQVTEQGSYSNANYREDDTHTNTGAFTISAHFPIQNRPVLNAMSSTHSAAFEPDDANGSWCPSVTIAVTTANSSVLSGNLQ